MLSVKKQIILKAVIILVSISIACAKGDHCTAVEESADETGIQSEDRGGMGEYGAVIEEYEFMLRSENEGFIPDKWKYVYNELFYIGKCDGVLYYALEDISGDGYPELIVGRKWDTPNWGAFLYNYLSLSYREENVVLKSVEDTSTVRPYIVYFKGERGMETCVCNEYKMTIYINGVIELEKPYVRKYFQIEDDTGSLKCLDEFKTVRVRNKEVEFYRKDKEGGSFEEILKEKYIDNVNGYLLDMMELEWIPIDGDCTDNQMSK